MYCFSAVTQKRVWKKGGKCSSRFWSRKEAMPSYCWCSVLTGVLSPSPWWEIPSFNLLKCSRMIASNFLSSVLSFCFSSHSKVTGIKTLEVTARGWNRISSRSIAGNGVLDGRRQPCVRKHLAEQGPAEAVCCGLVFLGIPSPTLLKKACFILKNHATRCSISVGKRWL